MKKIGITGGIASGKSLVSRVLEEMGYPIFYSDRKGKELLRTSTDLKQQITTLLGTEAYKDGVLNTSYIASLVFRQPELLEKMNAIVHPAVRKSFSEWCEHQNSTIVFNEAAIIFETGMYLNYDATILVTAPLETRISRAMLRDRSSREEVIQRMDRQWPDEKKIPFASFVIVNDDQTPVVRQIEQFLETIS
jgi:dephospho-CoA kinase